MSHSPFTFQVWDVLSHEFVTRPKLGSYFLTPHGDLHRIFPPVNDTTPAQICDDRKQATCTAIPIYSFTTPEGNRREPVEAVLERYKNHVDYERIRASLEKLTPEHTGC